MIELIERDAQLAQLRSRMALAGRAGGNIALVSGEAGIGKTSLVRELARRSPGLALWWGSCDALQTPDPLAPLHDIARDARAGFGALLAGGAKGSALFGEVIRELESLGPALLVIEDAHWADESTLDLIRYVGRRIDRTRAVMIVTFRQDEVSAVHPLRTAIGDLPPGLTERIELQRFSPEAVNALARQALRSPVGLHETTGGNPFFLTELLRHGVDGVPRSVQDLVLARFARLPPKAREIVQLASIVPARIERWLVDELLSPAAADLEACLDSGLLLADGQSLFFRHELARVAVEGALSAPLANALHLRALDSLVKRNASPACAARHVHHAIGANDGAAVLAYAPAAAAQAIQRGGHREAAAHYRTVLRFHAGLSPEQHVGFLEAYALQCQATNQLQEAIAARERIEALLRGRGSARDDARNLSQLALVLVLALRNAEADAASRRAIAFVEHLPPSPELANAYRVEAQLRMLNRDCREAVEWGTKAVELAGQLGEREILAAAHGTVGAAMLFLDYEAGRRHIERAIEIAIAGKLDYILANAYSNLGSASGELLRLHDAARYLKQAVEFSTANEIDFYRTYSLAWMGITSLFLGRWDDAESQACEALESAAESSTARVMALCALGRIRMRRGDAGADPLLDEAASLAEASGTLQRLAPVRIARAEAAFRRGDMAGVQREAGPALALARAHSHPWYVGELSCWLWRAGGAHAPAAECAEPFALLLEGQWRAAAAAWAARGCPYEQALALEAGDDGARIEALGILEGLGARPAAEALRKAMRDAGVRGVPRGPRSSTQRNPRGLTAKELEILELLCEGLKNSEIAERLFRSVRTVEHHVDSILGKLEAKSRAEVPAIARREGFQFG